MNQSHITTRGIVGAPLTFVLAVGTPAGPHGGGRPRLVKDGCGAIFRADLSHPGAWKRTARTLTISTILDLPSTGKLINVWTLAPA